MSFCVQVVNANDITVLGRDDYAVVLIAHCQKQIFASGSNSDFTENIFVDTLSDKRGAEENVRRARINVLVKHIGQNVRQVQFWIFQVQRNKITQPLHISCGVFKFVVNQLCANFGSLHHARFNLSGCLFFNVFLPLKQKFLTTKKNPD